MSAVAILDVHLDVITYKGDPVATFAQVDKVHGRVDGTAGRTFRENRERFVEGEDFVTGNLDEMRRAFPSAMPARGGGDITLLTRRGYLKLTKPMSDDRAWAVQGEMVDRYFAAERMVSAAAPTRIPASRASATFKGFASIARTLLGMDRNQVAFSANMATRSLTGVDVLAEMGATHLLAPQQARHITPTEIGQRLGSGSAKTTNALLERHGYQTSGRDPAGKVVWEPAPKGRPFAVMLDTGKRAGGTPVRQLRWSADIVDALRADVTAADQAA